MQKKIPYGLIMLWMLLCPVAPATAQVGVSVGISSPNVSIGINLPFYPELVPVPGYPVYYAPQLDVNFFFYDGLYWVFQDGNWYASYWYNGPWSLVAPDVVPVFILSIPLSYYRNPPVYFRGWHPNAPPHWGEHWGHEWERHHHGWNNWKRGMAPAPAPLPDYQRQYSGERYPRQVEQQRELQQRNYHYQPRDSVVRQHYQERNEQRAPEERGSRQQEYPAAPREQPRPRSQGRERNE